MEFKKKRLRGKSGEKKKVVEFVSDNANKKAARKIKKGVILRPSKYERRVGGLCTAVMHIVQAFALILRGPQYDTSSFLFLRLLIPNNLLLHRNFPPAREGFISIAQVKDTHHVVFITEVEKSFHCWFQRHAAGAPIGGNVQRCCG